MTGLINSKYANPLDDNPDVQLFFAGYMTRCSESESFSGNSISRRQIAFIPTLIHPKSKGYLQLRNSDPLSKPLIYPKYLTHPDDISVMIEAIKFALRFAETEALKK